MLRVGDNKETWNVEQSRDSDMFVIFLFFFEVIWMLSVEGERLIFI